jgi:hypothetical protein
VIEAPRHVWTGKQSKTILISIFFIVTNIKDFDLGELCTSKFKFRVVKKTKLCMVLLRKKHNKTASSSHASSLRDKFETTSVSGNTNKVSLQVPSNLREKVTNNYTTMTPTIKTKNERTSTPELLEMVDADDKQQTSTPAGIQETTKTTVTKIMTNTKKAMTIFRVKKKLKEASTSPKTTRQNDNKVLQNESESEKIVSKQKPTLPSIIATTMNDITVENKIVEKTQNTESKNINNNYSHKAPTITKVKELVRTSEELVNKLQSSPTATSKNYKKTIDGKSQTVTPFLKATHRKPIRESRHSVLSSGAGEDKIISEIDNEDDVNNRVWVSSSSHSIRKNLFSSLVCQIFVLTWYKIIF